MRLTFLGAAGTVTGSRNLVEYGNRRILVDCGLFQGLKQLRLRNWAAFPILPTRIDAVVLTHAHLDHSGYLPRLVREGFSGTIYCTPATRDLCRILLMDSALIMEEEAESARRHGYSRHADPLPLYTAADVEKTLRLFRTVDWHQAFRLQGGLEFAFHRAGHILGASFVHVRQGTAALVFSGDLGRREDPFFPPPEPPPLSDYLVVESTYGNRLHENADVTLQLEQAIRGAVDKGGALLIPSFAVGRTQTLLLRLWELKKAGRLPGIPIFVDSPMAANVTRLYLDHASDHDLSPEECEAAFGIAHYVQTPQESREVSRHAGPVIIISASGMITGGRILHHLKVFAPRPTTTILLAGYQAAGTRGALLAGGAESIKIHGQWVKVAAEVASLRNFSAHADAHEIVQWLKGARSAPRRIFITHGEPAAADALRQRIGRDLGWDGHVPEHLEAVELGGPTRPGSPA